MSSTNSASIIEFMVNPIYQNAINQAGLQEQSAAANAAMIITGLEKELNEKQVKVDAKSPKIDFDQLSKYVQKLVDIREIKKVKEQKKREEKEGALEYFVKIGTSLVARRKKRAYHYLKRQRQRNIVNVGEIDVFSKLKKVDPKLLKEYIVLQSRALTKTPKDKLDEIIKRLHEIETSLKVRDVSQEVINLIKARVKSVVEIELAELIREKLHADLSDPKIALKTVLGSTASVKLLGFLFFNEITHQVPLEASATDSAMEKTFKNIANSSLPQEIKNLKALLNFIKELNIDLKNWIATWNFEKITIGENGEIVINTSLTDRLREIKLLHDELTLLETQKHLEIRLFNRIFLYYRIREIEATLEALGNTIDEILAIRERGRHIAWLKLVAILKEFHLKRVFCESFREFAQHSAVISYLTQKARKLGTHISEEGVKLLQIELEKLAMDTAQYKLELLKSMQEISPDKTIEKDIRRLSSVIAHIKHRRSQRAAFSEFSNAILSFFYHLKFIFRPQKKL